MDSGNSGSLQSSSGGGGGGDEEYESRTDQSISSFLNPSSNHFASISNPNPNQNQMLQHVSLSHHQHPPTAFFDQNSLDSPNPDRNPLYNLDLANWSRTLRSEPNFSDFGMTQQTLLGTSQHPYPNNPSSSNDANASTQRSANPPPVIKNPKKRTRASRRAPTTVLTTDTTNFRQMVQEFTGIPAAPFSGSSPFSNRLDLFGGGSSMGVGPLYPLRPSPQKIQLSPPSFLTSTTTTAVANNSSASTSGVGTSSNNYQQSLEFAKQPQNLLNLQNPIFTFQSLLQSTNQNPLVNAPILGTKSDQPTNLSINPLVDDIDHHQRQVNSNVSGFPSASSSTRWRNHGGQDENLGSFDGENGNSQTARGYKLNSSDFQPDKGLENVVSSRSDHQGNMDSWVCPSD